MCGSHQIAIIDNPGQGCVENKKKYRPIHLPHFPIHCVFVSELRKRILFANIRLQHKMRTESAKSLDIQTCLLYQLGNPCVMFSQNCCRPVGSQQPLRNEISFWFSSFTRRDITMAHCVVDNVALSSILHLLAHHDLLPTPLFLHGGSLVPPLIVPLWFQEMTEVASLLPPDHRLTTVRRYEAGPPEGLELVRQIL